MKIYCESADSYLSRSPEAIDNWTWRYAKAANTTEDEAARKVQAFIRGVFAKYKLDTVPLTLAGSMVTVFIDRAIKTLTGAKRRDEGLHERNNTLCSLLLGAAKSFKINLDGVDSGGFGAIFNRVHRHFFQFCEKEYPSADQWVNGDNFPEAWKKKKKR